MTPEEKAVIKAAVEMRNALTLDPHVPPGTGQLINAIDALIYSCPQCNAGGHTCLGCGENIAHTETACPNWEQGCATLERPAEWVPATMREAIKGDTVRLGTSEAKVAGIGPDWKGHVDPRSGKYEALPLEHTLIPVRLEGRDDLLHLAPTLEIEILMTIERRAALVVQRAFPGSSVTS